MDSQDLQVLAAVRRWRAEGHRAALVTVAQTWGSAPRPAWEKATAIARSLHQRGILTKLRNSAGQDVDGGCGQLRARAIAGETPVRFVR